MQNLTLFIVIAISRPLIKNPLSVCGSNNYCGSASASGSAHLCCTVHVRHAECHCWQTSRASSTLMHACSPNP